MPSWKKVIISGSAAELSSVFAPSITGSLQGTASFARTASFVTGSNVYGPFGANSIISASYATTASVSLASSANQILGINKSGFTITKGTVVHLTGSTNSSDTPYITTASYESDNLSANTLGIAAETITFNSTGYITTEGVLTGLNVTGYQAGQIVYLGAGGTITGSAPIAPLHSVRLGQVVRDSPTNNGSIYVRIDNGYEIGELHDVIDSTTNASFGDLLVKSGSVWKTGKQLTGSYGLTGSLTVTGSTTTDLVRITQTGTGNAFVVEDSTNPDVTPFVITNSGRVGIGISSPTVQLDVSGSVEIIESASYIQDGQNVIRIAKGTDSFYANIVAGAGAGTNTQHRQTVFGYAAGATASGSNQSAFGYNAGYLNTGSRQTAFGALAGGYNKADYQTAAGYQAGFQNSGSNQTAFGYATGQYNSGSNQTAVGVAAGQYNSAASQTAIGVNAGLYNSGSFQTAVGVNAGTYNPSEYQSVFGRDAGINQTGSRQTAVGALAGGYNKADYQTAAGYQAGYLNVGLNQTAFGYVAGQTNSGSNQTAVGVHAGQSNSGSFQTAVGANAGRYNSASFQTAIGGMAGYQNAGSDQSAFGYNAGYQNTGSYQTAIGSNAGYQNTATQQTAVGLQAGYLNIGVTQTALGQQAGQSNSGSTQTAVGYASGFQNSGSLQVAIGAQAGRDNKGANQTATGYEAGRLNIGANQVAMGNSAGEGNSGNNQTAIGSQAGFQNSGIYQTAIGTQAGYLNSGSNQTAVGYNAGFQNSGSDNTNVGYRAGYLISAGTVNSQSAQSVFLGSETRAAAGNQTNQIVIGYGVTGIGSNSVVLGNSSIQTTALRGFVGIGTTAPTKIFEVVSGSNTAYFDLTATAGPLAAVVTSDFTKLARFNASDGTNSISVGLRSSAETANPGFGEQNDTYIYANSNANGLNIINAAGTGTEDYIKFFAGNVATSTPSMIIIGSGSTKGNVGIGTTTPTAKLEVNGDFKFGTFGTPSSMSFGSYQYGTDLDISLISSAGGWARANRIKTADPSGSIFFGVHGTGTGLIKSFWTIDTPGSTNFYATTNGINLLKNGNVGIGVITPTAKLHINNTGSDNSFLIEDSTNPDSTPFVIDNSGSVGIGMTTPTPSTKLDILYTGSDTGVLIRGGGAVSDSIPLSLWDTGTAANNRNIILFGHSNLYVTGSRIYSTNPSANATTGAKLVFETTSDDIGTFNTNQLVLSNNGNVGIGTDTPTYTLQIQAAPTASIRLQETGSGGNKRLDLTIDASGVARISANQSAQQMAFDTVGSERIRITGTGNVGIGTTTPTGKLTVSGSGGYLSYNDTDAAGNLLVLSGSSDELVRIDVSALSASVNTAVSYGIRGVNDTGYPGYGKVTDGFMYASNFVNGLNIINYGEGTKEDYIRFYAGTNATATPNIHIQGSGSNKGFIGINKIDPIAQLDVNGNTIISGSLTTTSSVAFKAYTSATSFPGTAAGYLAFDSAGNILTTAGVAAGAAGNNTEVQFNNGGALAGTPIMRIVNSTIQISSSTNITGSITIGSDTNTNLDPRGFVYGSGSYLNGIASNDYTTYSAILGGTFNKINTDGTRNVILGGTTNTITGSGDPGGHNDSVIIGGSYNTIDSSSPSEGELIAASYSSSIKDGRYISIIASSNCDIDGSSGFNENIAMIACVSSSINSEKHAVIIGGEKNTFQSSSSRLRSVILGGSNITGSKSDTVYMPNAHVTGSVTVEGGGNITGSLNITGSADITGHVKITPITTGSSAGNLAIQSDGKIIKAGGNAIVENYYYSVSNSADTTFYEDDKVRMKWDETGNDLKFTMLVAPGGSGDMRSLGVLMGSTSTFNVAITTINVEYDLYSAGISAGNRMQAFVTAENDVTYPAYHVTAYNTGESYHNTIWIQKIIKI